MSDARQEFSPEQQSYLQGFALGADVARKVRGLPLLTDAARSGETVIVGAAAADSDYALPERRHFVAQDRQTQAGGKLCAEERAKRAKNALDMWPEIEARAAAGKFPSGTDVFLQKFQGLFYVAPAQDAYMCRLRFPGGAVRSEQLLGLARLAETYAGGYADVTTRANLQLREIPAADPIHVLTGLRELEIVNTGAGGDNVRNVTASPLSGIDPDELIETLPLARQMHWRLLQERDLFGLPRKFNIAFDGGGAVSALEDTNDIGFHAVALEPDAATPDFPPGVYFRLALGGITGHGDFARATGVLLRPDQCVPVAIAMLRVYIEHGDRTNRNRARLKYLLDDWGFERFLQAVEEKVGPLPRGPEAGNSVRSACDRLAHVGVHPQRQPGRHYLGLVLPVGRITAEQMRGVAEIAATHGSGEVRLTVWQNLLIPNLADERLPQAQAAVEAMGLDWRSDNIRAGLIACTGNAGCKYAASDTKRHAAQLADYVEQRLDLDHPVNIHLTGCHHSCAQHYIGDIGMLAANVEQGDDVVEGYRLFVGGGHGPQQAIGRELFSPLAYDEIPPLVVRMLEAYQCARQSASESFAEFTNRFEIDELRKIFAATPVTH